MSRSDPFEPLVLDELAVTANRLEQLYHKTGLIGMDCGDSSVQVSTEAFLNTFALDFTLQSFNPDGVYPYKAVAWYHGVCFYALLTAEETALALETQKAEKPAAVWQAIKTSCTGKEESVPALRGTFQSPYDQYKMFKGQPFELIRTISEPDKDHDAEVLPLYVIKFSDGTTIEAWPEEIHTNTTI